MQALTFKRGVHPPDGKELAKDQPIKVIMPKENSELFYPMSQHIGAPCDPLVAVGDHVKVGQKIAESGAFMSSPIFASVSGEVVDIRPMLVPGGAMVKAIVVKNDGKMEEIEGLNEGKDYTTMTNDEILAAIKNAGVVGLGGAGFPTHVKLNPPKDTPIDHILINAAECEPYLTCDYRLMIEEPERIVRGLQIMLKLHPNAKGVIGIEMNKPEAIASMQKACEGIDNITVQPLVTKFPQGSEKHLIYAITKREVKSGALPASAGCIVDNVDTVVAIERAICKGRPLMRRIVTVSGKGIKNPGNYKIRIGINHANSRTVTNILRGFARKITSALAINIVNVDKGILFTVGNNLSYSRGENKLIIIELCNGTKFAVPIHYFVDNLLQSGNAHYPYNMMRFRELLCLFLGVYGNSLLCTVGSIYYIISRSLCNRRIVCYKHTAAIL